MRCSAEPLGCVSFSHYSFQATTLRATGLRKRSLNSVELGNAVVGKAPPWRTVKDLPQATSHTLDGSSGRLWTTNRGRQGGGDSRRSWPYCCWQKPSIQSDSMLRNVVITLCLILASVPTWASASRGSSRSATRSASRSAGRTTSRSATRYKSPATKCTSCARAANGKIARSPAARRSFRSSHPCPATGKTSGACRGYVVDHVVPLAPILFT